MYINCLQEILINRGKTNQIIISIQAQKMYKMMQDTQQKKMEKNLRVKEDFQIL